MTGRQRVAGAGTSVRLVGRGARRGRGRTRPCRRHRADRGSRIGQSVFPESVTCASSAAAGLSLPMIYYAALTHMFVDAPRGSSRDRLRAVRALLYLTLVMVSIATDRPAAAQTGATGGDLSGIVRDPLAAVLPGATVTATNLEVGLTRTVVTETNGRFVVPALPPGSYRLQIAFPGFAPYVAEDVRVALGGLLDLDVRMELAGTQEQVTVRGDAPYAGNLNTTVSALVSRTQIEELPVDRRNFIGFTLLTPGVTTDRIPLQTQGATPTSGLSFAGQRPRSNNITVDGLDNNDITVGAVRATFSQDAVREYQVLASSYSAEFGKASGGLVNIVTRSGTNAFENQEFV